MVLLAALVLLVPVGAIAALVAWINVAAFAGFFPGDQAPALVQACGCIDFVLIIAFGAAALVGLIMAVCWALEVLFT